MKNYIDLTHTISRDTPVIPGRIRPEITQDKTINIDGRSVQKISFFNHIGTHIDAPSHFITDGQRSDEIKISDLIGDCVILDFTCKGEGDVISADELLEILGSAGYCKKIIIKTGWSAKFDSNGYFDSFPVFDIEAAKFLAKKPISLLGMDTPSPGPLDNIGDEIHRILLKKGIYILEGLNNLSRINRSPFKLYVFPLSLKGCSGAPCRVVAEVDI